MKRKKMMTEELLRQLCYMSLGILITYLIIDFSFNLNFEFFLIPSLIAIIPMVLYGVFKFKKSIDENN